MKLYHGTSCQNVEEIQQEGLIPADESEQIWSEATLQKKFGVYLTDELERARMYACQTTKTKNPDYLEPIDLEMIFPNPYDVCIYEVELPDDFPNDFPLERDDIDPRNWRTINQSIPTRYLELLRPEDVANRLDISVRNICLPEREEVEYNLMKYEMDY